MTTSTSDPGMTAKVFLFDSDSDEDTASIISRAVKDHGLARSALRGLRRLSGSTLDSIDETVGSVADGLLDVDLGDILVSGWRKYSVLTDSARRTLAVEGTQEVVVLAEHRVEFAYSPHVDLLLDGVKLNSFEFELTVTVDVTGLSAVIRAGQLVSLRGGKCLVSGKLTLEGGTVAQRQRELDVELLVNLKQPVALVTAPERFLPRQPGPRTADTSVADARSSPPPGLIGETPGSRGPLPWRGDAGRTRQSDDRGHN